MVLQLCTISNSCQFSQPNVSYEFLLSFPLSNHYLLLVTLTCPCITSCNNTNISWHDLSLWNRHVSTAVGKPSPKRFLSRNWKKSAQEISLRENLRVYYFRFWYHVCIRKLVCQIDANVEKIFRGSFLEPFQDIPISLKHNKISIDPSEQLVCSLYITYEHKKNHLKIQALQYWPIYYGFSWTKKKVKN